MSRKEKLDSEIARRFMVSGRVQGVGYRYFVERGAAELGLAGYARNLASGDVEVYAVGTAKALSDLEGRLRVGSRFAGVRQVDAQDAAVIKYFGFHIE